MSEAVQSIPSTQGIQDPNVIRVLDPIRRILEERTTGAKKWLDANSLKGVNGVLYNILTNNGTITGNPLSFATPPAPEGLEAFGTFNNIYLRWNHIPYSNHAYTEIWRSAEDDLGTAVKISTAAGNLYVDPVDDGSTYYYWIRFVSQANVPGPYNKASGTEGATSETPDRILEALTGAIGESHLIEALVSDIEALRNEKIIKVNKNGYVAGIGIAVVDNASGNPTGQVVILSDKFAIVTPNNDPDEAPTIPFIVGRIGNKNTVGINGRLVVNGTILGQSIAAKTITADLLSVGKLSAISADIGDVTSGTFRTGTSGMRAEISSVGGFPIWAGSGTKTADNAIFYVDTDGNGVFRGILAAAGGVFSGTLDGVDGIFNGTVYAQNIIGDVIDRLVVSEDLVDILRIDKRETGSPYPDYVYYRYGSFLKSDLHVGEEITLASIGFAAQNFNRKASFSGFSVIWINGGFGSYESAFRYKIYLNGSLYYSGELIAVSIKDQLPAIIKFDILPIDLALSFDHAVIIKIEIVDYYVAKEAYPEGSSLGANVRGSLYNYPGIRVIEGFNSDSEGIVYI